MSQIFVFVDDTSMSSLPDVALQMAASLSKTYSKQICLLAISESDSDFESKSSLLSKLNAECVASDFRVLKKDEDFTEFMEQTEASMLLFQVEDKRSQVMSYLKLCRGLRIPYFFCRAEHKVAFTNILVPVTFLIEDREKGPFASSFGRFFSARVTLLKPKDYGSRAQQTIDAIDVLLEKAGVVHDIMQGSKDSFKVEREASEVALSKGYDLVICSASREYGIDDIVFGPRELKAIRKSSVPVMLINPRSDLYTLCG